ncbi:NACHT, LRR and PYD domains-containing protein 3-like isoform X2 [Scleropages formosus]|uniref:NACHT, LRR and PYD domains-containing protein 3-like isoform X2 n=1 Tax=Scleropages formosus TaxID=113540 RepID=UPI0010FABDFE|nr:NACHT, LRR and PYD domains-containing protein 3-like isoform X2 [Scleropages formosus]
MSLSEEKKIHDRVTNPESKRVQQERSESHAPSCVSMKSDWSLNTPLEFQKEGIPTDKRDQQKFGLNSSCQNASGQQIDLSSLFKPLEKRAVKFLKDQLKKIKMHLEGSTAMYMDDQTPEKCGRDGALKITMHILRTMNQEELAERLEKSELLIECHHKHKSTLKNKLKCLFEGKAMQGNHTLLSKIYTELYITEGRTGGISEEHEVRQIEIVSKGQTSQETAINCNDIFQPLLGQETHIRTVLTKGVAGIGKTVSVQKFILDWAEGKANQDILLIFALPFRDLNLLKSEKYSLTQLLQHFLPEFKIIGSVEPYANKVLFILDGMDECRLPLDFKKNESCFDITTATSLDVLLTNLIKGNLLPSARIWITSRPAAASQIPSEYVHRVTDIQGFNDSQKEIYFRKRFSDQDLANRIIAHMKSSKTLYIMCHIPVFCWISATVFEHLMREADRTKFPKTLTQMYTHFLIFQMRIKNEKYGRKEVTDHWQSEQKFIMKLGKLAFHNLQKGNLLFYEEDLRDFGIDVSEALVYSGVCTEILTEDTGLYEGKVYCFVHLSVQEYLAALYTYLSHSDLPFNVLYWFPKESTSLKTLKNAADQALQSTNGNFDFNLCFLLGLLVNTSVNKFKRFLRENTAHNLITSTVDQALQSKNGHLDLYLRFLLGLSLDSSQSLLQGLLTQTAQKSFDSEKIIEYIKQKIRENISPERTINLFHCLSELNDNSLVKEVQSYLKSQSVLEKLSPAQWSALAFVLLTSEEDLDVFDLKKYSRSDKVLLRLLPVVKASRTALLSSCKLTMRCCEALASVISSKSCCLKELDLNDNDLQDSGVVSLLTGLANPYCKLKILRLKSCNLTAKCCEQLASAIKSNTSLIELDLSDNDLQDSGVNYISSAVVSVYSKLETLRLNSSNLTGKCCEQLASTISSNSSLMEVDLSDNDLQDSGVKLLSSAVVSVHSKLETMRLSCCGVTEEGCFSLASALRSNPSHLRELDMSGNHIVDSGVISLCVLLVDSSCKLEKLRLFDGQELKRDPTTLASVLCSKLSELSELDLSNSHIGDSGVDLLCAVLEDPHCTPETLRLKGCKLSAKCCEGLASALLSNCDTLRELDMSDNDLQDSGVKLLCAALGSPQSKLVTIMLSNCGVTEEGYSALASVLGSNSSHLRELDMSRNNPKDSGLQQLCAVLQTPNCKLKNLNLSDCGITEEGCFSLASALRSNPSHLRELDMSGNHIVDSGVISLCVLLVDSSCKLEKLRLFDGQELKRDPTTLASVLCSKLSELSELDLSNSHIGNSGVDLLCAVLEDPHCKPETLRLKGCKLSAKCCEKLASTLLSNCDTLRELDMSDNELQDSGVKLLCAALENPQCKLATLMLRECGITEEGFSSLASALHSNPFYLRELDMSSNRPGDSGVKRLSDILLDPKCQLEKVQLSSCGVTKNGSSSLTSALCSNPSHLRELDLSNNHLGNSEVILLCALLVDSHCKLETLRIFQGQDFKKNCSDVASALCSNLSDLRELDLSNNHIQASRMKLLCAVLEDHHCKLEILRLSGCEIREEGCSSLASALCSNPSHLRELDLNYNDPGDSGVKLLSALLEDPRCKLEKLQLSGCEIREEGCSSLASALCSNPSHLRELDLNYNDPGDSGVKLLSALLKDPRCKLEILRIRRTLG